MVTIGKFIYPLTFYDRRIIRQHLQLKHVLDDVFASCTETVEIVAEMIAADGARQMWITREYEEIRAINRCPLHHNCQIRLKEYLVTMAEMDVMDEIDRCMEMMQIDGINVNGKNINDCASISGRIGAIQIHRK